MSLLMGTWVLEMVEPEQDVIGRVIDMANAWSWRRQGLGYTVFWNLSCIYLSILLSL